MAAYRPPSDESMGPQDTHLAPDPCITTVPVTPGTSIDGGSSYAQSSPQRSHDEEILHWNANSYSAPSHSDLQSTPSSPAEVVKGAKTGPELLRRLSLIDAVKPEEVVTDPRAAHPGLHLSGNVISANFTIPYNVGMRFGADWVCYRILASFGGELLNAIRA
jgi:trehalose 6-phosphate synthase/phosphatase